MFTHIHINNLITSITDIRFVRYELNIGLLCFSKISYNLYTLRMWSPDEEMKAE